MPFNIHSNGDVYAQEGINDVQYVGKIDSDGQFRAVDEDAEDYEEYIGTEAAAMYSDKQESAWEKSDWPENIVTFLSRWL